MFERLLNQTLRTSIAKRWLVVVASILISLWGLSSVSRMPLDVFPQFAPPQVDVQTTAAGLAPEEVERRITMPIESAVNGLPGVETVRSSSKVGLSMVQVVFAQNADINRARQAVAERLQPIEAELPASASAPAISPLVSPLGTILQYAFTLKDGGPTGAMELRRIVSTTFSNQILAVPGVSQVILYGGEEAQQQIRIDPQQLLARNVSLQAVAEAAGAASAHAPGGFLIAGGQEKLIRASGQASSSDDLADSVVMDNKGQPLRLGDVAEVSLASALKRGDGSFNGKPAVVLMVNKQPDIDTPRVTRAVEERIAALSKGLPSDIQVKRTFRQASFIESAIKNVSSSLIEGVLIVSVVTVLFLMNWRTAVITLSAIPVSLLIGLMLMRAFGLEINTMTLGGLVVAIGSVVDDAIVDMENCYTGLRQNQAAAHPRKPLQVVFEASVEVRQPVLLSSLIIVVVFAPIFSLTGVEGRIFAPMGLAYVFSIVASSFVALTLTPALCAILLANTRLPAENTWIAS
jgi:nickel/cobalt tolerance cation efflux system protein